MTGIAAVQARIAELEQLVAPRPATSSVAPSTVDFAAALAAAGLTPSPTSLPAAPADPGGVTADIAPGSGVSAQDLIEAATKYTGTPYVWGGETLSEGGLDCSGLVLRALSDLGIGRGIPRVARDQQGLGTKVASLDEALPGDLLVFGGGTHIAIYVGDGKMLDAPKPGGTVGVRDVWAEPTNIRRILPQESATAAAAVSAGAGAAPSGSGLASLAGLLRGSSADSTAATQAAWQVLLGAVGTSAPANPASAGALLGAGSPLASTGTSFAAGTSFSAGAGLAPASLIAALTGGAA